MALSIKDAETDRLVRRYAQLHDISYTGAIKRAITTALESEGHIPSQEERERIRREFLETARRARAEFARLPTLDPRPHGEMLYDEDGLPK